MVPDSTDNTTVEKFYQDLFNIQGDQDFTITINASDNYYSHTAEYHQTFAKRATTVERIMQCQMRLWARAKQDQIESNKDYIRQQLINMREQYAVCKLSTCDGTIAKCLDKDSRHYCYSCHAYSCDENYHQNCIARQIINEGQSCPFCFLALDKGIGESSTRDEH